MADASEKDEIRPLHPNPKKNEKPFQPTQDATGSTTGGKHISVDVEGHFSRCDYPYCTACPTNYEDRPTNTKGDTKTEMQKAGRGELFLLHKFIRGIKYPHTRAVQWWNKFFVILCLIAVFVDPIFFFLLSAEPDNKCLVLISLTLKTVLVSSRCVTDIVYLLHMLLQFRLAYINAGELVDKPKKIVLNYLTKKFLIDLFVVLPLPQILVFVVVPPFNEANFVRNILTASILVQCIPRLCRILPMFADQTDIGFTFESMWSNFVINLLTFVLSGHIVGSCWYLFGLQRVNQCLRDACRDSGMKDCIKFIDCGNGNDVERFKAYPTEWESWKQNVNATACFHVSKQLEARFSYGIYEQAVELTTKSSLITRYVYSLFWGFQQISTLAGNQTPSYHIWEVVFTMCIIAVGLLLFALLIGNMQNILQALGRRRLEMSIRRRDVEQWMRHQRFPPELTEEVRESERFHWAATRGVNELKLLENFPEDLQRNIRQHLFKLGKEELKQVMKEVQIFAMMDEPILDAICERLRQKTYIKESIILVRGELIDKMVFIVRGKLESIGDDKNTVHLVEGDVCGKELLTWCLEHSFVNKDQTKTRLSEPKLLSKREIKCSTNVEAFTLRAADLEEVISRFSRFLEHPCVQGAIRYKSPYWRSLPASRIQVAWRYRKKCQVSNGDPISSIVYKRILKKAPGNSSASTIA